VAIDSAGLGLRIAEARQRAGLTQADVSRLAALDRSAVAKIETGVRRVTALELAQIADAVGERVEWFVDEPVPAVVSHRNMADPGEPSPPIDQAIDRVVRAVEFTSEHDDGLRQALRTLPVFGEMVSLEDAEKLAEQARKLLGVNSGEPLQALSSKLVSVGVLTFVAALGREAADAGSVHLASGAVAVVNGALPTGRRRLALAHEFGHVLVTDEYTVDWRIDSGMVDDRERAIDRFARALLLPRASLARQWRLWGGADDETRREAAVRIASLFRVDMSTLARRLGELDLIDPVAGARVRTFKTNRADIVKHDLVVADELPPGELPRVYEAAVLRLYSSETVSEIRALDLLLDTWDASELPTPPTREESEIWQFVS
jgi:Zn-dependent peptidase ImmA (M78 family)/DNA-binding XRE family transcriptional regulator